MKLSKLFSVEGTSWDECLAASYFLASSDTSLNAGALSAEAAALLQLLRAIDNAWARELAAEVLLAC